ncbi:MAG: hypothetical protein J6P20_03390 [Oscillospiraceae bacterium]|nr:hypothetical protein [Oscillospiraceae bacterium]
MRKHTIFAGCAALVTALCGHPAAYAASAPQEFAVFGDHSAFDPLNPYYIYGKALLNGTKKLPADGNYYFTGQIFIAGERCQEEIPVVPKAAYLYSETAKGYFVWREETPLSLSDAEKYCALLWQHSDALEGFVLTEEPTPVYCTYTPTSLAGDLDYDAKVTTNDARKLLDAVVYESVSEEFKTLGILGHLYPNADVNENGTRDITDVKHILDYAVYTQTFGTAPEWKAITGK